MVGLTEGTWEQAEEAVWWDGSIGAALRHARAAGMALADLTGIYFPNRASGWVTFQRESDGKIRAFDADGEREIRT